MTTYMNLTGKKKRLTALRHYKTINYMHTCMQLDTLFL
jgi:hypothetical protein